MPSHVTLLVVIISVNNSRSCSYSYMKFKPSKETSQMIKWKYFYSADEQPQMFIAGNIVFISGKYIVEKSEQCINSSCKSKLKKPDYADLDVRCHKKVKQPDNDDELDEGEIS
ncbi:13836_t:CDS:1 [Cetraspora pellucida]|uniref:13836_t:CDS:1 n=1 Tax=Cetraspora pellucida TaxID=1433469 RepID=A0A9N9PA49_9GLOM|nr:13836_t:CDS:1 [Cetraspora pellucida]